MNGNIFFPVSKRYINLASESGFSVNLRDAHGAESCSVLNACKYPPSNLTHSNYLGLHVQPIQRLFGKYSHVYRC